MFGSNPYTALCIPAFLVLFSITTLILLARRNDRKIEKATKDGEGHMSKIESVGRIIEGIIGAGGVQVVTV